MQHFLGSSLSQVLVYFQQIGDDVGDFFSRLHLLCMSALGADVIGHVWPEYIV